MAHLLQGLVRQRDAISQALQEGGRVFVLRICWHALQGALHVICHAQQAAHKLLHGQKYCEGDIGKCAVTWLI